ncbi:unnamed protein product [Lampetra fluviatilis]
MASLRRLISAHSPSSSSSAMLNQLVHDGVPKPSPAFPRPRAETFVLHVTLYGEFPPPRRRLYRATFGTGSSESLPRDDGSFSRNLANASSGTPSGTEESNRCAERIVGHRAEQRAAERAIPAQVQYSTQQ